MKRVLVTGLNSFVGNAFYEYINNNYKGIYNIERVSLKNNDIKKLDLKEYNAILHVAGIAHSDYGKISEDKVKIYYDINTNLTFSLAKKAKEDGVKQFVFMSSIIVYGNSAPIGQKKVIEKETIPCPNNAYGDSKLKAEEKLKLLNSDDFVVSIIRAPMIYGNNSRGNYNTLKKIALKASFFPYIDNERSVISINNLCKIIKLIIDNEKSGIYFPQDNDYMNTSKMVERIASENNKQIVLLNGFASILKFCSLFTPMINKAFGNLVYDKNLQFKEF